MTCSYIARWSNIYGSVWHSSLAARFYRCVIPLFDTQRDYNRFLKEKKDDYDSVFISQ